MGAHLTESLKGTLSKKTHERSPITPLTSGAKTRENPMMNHKVDSSASPVNVCIITDNEFLSLSNPASKKPKPAIISMTSPVERNIHVVSPVSIANGHRRFLVDYKVFL